MPLGFLTEDGPRPDLAEAFGTAELRTADYPTRTRRNAAASGRVRRGAGLVIQRPPWP